MSDFWTEKRVAALTRMISEGMTALQASIELGCTRNAVIGKVHRGKGKYGTLAGRSYVPSPKNVAPKIVPKINPKVVKRKEGAITFWQAVDERRCAYAIDLKCEDGPEMMVCGGPIKDRHAPTGRISRSFCERHYKLCCQSSVRCR
jgi:hypothetical protein